MGHGYREGSAKVDGVGATVPEDARQPDDDPPEGDPGKEEGAAAPPCEPAGADPNAFTAAAPPFLQITSAGKRMSSRDGLQRVRIAGSRVSRADPNVGRHEVSVQDPGHGPAPAHEPARNGHTVLWERELQEAT